ncbi:MAG: AAA family ATPase [Firmicutes bacterium]|nr:AAA family ATPase [Bacillota bacterium]
MVYLDKFELMDEEGNPEFVQKIKRAYSADDRFPLGFFPAKGLKQLDFETVTIFYGGNGSGKSTLLNLIALKFGFLRHASAALSRSFLTYSDACNARHGKSLPPGSSMLTSEDVFKNIFSAREKNLDIDERKDLEEEFFDYGSFDYQFEGFENAHLVSKNLAKQRYVEKKAGIKQRQFSNGESAMQFFKSEIQPKTLYLLDEPENSMSPKFQLDLKTLLENKARYDGCQFIIATHSPFILAIADAKVYNLDAKPVTVEKWYNLKNIRAYYDFFTKYHDLFNLGDYDSGTGKFKKRK